MNKLVKEIKSLFPEYEVYKFGGSDKIIVEEDWEDNGCKNDDDCSDNAREIGERIIERFPQLEIYENMCHRHKYSVVELIKTKK